MAECPCCGICIGCTYIHSRNSKLRVRRSSKCTKERSERSLMSKLAVTARKDKPCMRKYRHKDGRTKLAAARFCHKL